MLLRLARSGLAVWAGAARCHHTRVVCSLVLRDNSHHHPVRLLLPEIQSRRHTVREMASGIMATATAIVGTLYYAVYPLLFLISSLLSLLGTLLMPFLHMGRYVLHFSLLPFRVLAKFEVRAWSAI